MAADQTNRSTGCPATVVDALAELIVEQLWPHGRSPAADQLDPVHDRG